ncbi:MFS-type transporter SLC18B1-like [Convolutriloba macropyga]|uniref:MFS-type transporter SLC18B1-like n=1 Tax=Convolutriloba macropyga TaxID=536237 RepID=UPI003F5269C5
MSGTSSNLASTNNDTAHESVPETEALISKSFPEFTNWRRVFVVALCSVTLILEGVNLSLPGPFFPREAEIKGLSQFQIGLVVGSFDLTNLCFSFVVASLVTPKNIKFVFVTGTLWSSITVSSFGLLSESPSGDIFFYSCFFTRLFNGAGAAMLYGTAMPVAVQMFPEKAALITTIIQSSIGCGLCLGPPIGSLLLPLGGYKVPFLVVGITELFVFASSSFIIPNESVKTKSKVRSSDYVRFLGKFSTLSVVIPTATLYFIPGIRDTAYSLYFENVLAVDSKKGIYSLMQNLHVA